MQVVHRRHHRRIGNIAFCAEFVEVEIRIQRDLDCIAGIAVIALGFLAFAGRLSWFTAGAVVLGIGLVFGAPTIVDEMIAAVGN